MSYLSSTKIRYSLLLTFAFTMFLLIIAPVAQAIIISSGASTQFIGSNKVGGWVSIEDNIHKNYSSCTVTVYSDIYISVRGWDYFNCYTYNPRENYAVIAYQNGNGEYGSGTYKTKELRNYAKKTYYRYVVSSRLNFNDPRSDIGQHTPTYSAFYQR